MPDIQDYLAFRREANRFARFLGLEMTKMEEGYAEGILHVRDDYYNSAGSVHGGCLFTVADTIAGNAACSRGSTMTTLSSDFHYLRPCIGVRQIHARAREIKYGKRVCVYSVELHDGNGGLYAAGTFSFFNLGTPLIH